MARMMKREKSAFIYNFNHCPYHQSYTLKLDIGDGHEISVINTRSYPNECKTCKYCLKYSEKYDAAMCDYELIKKQEEEELKEKAKEQTKKLNILRDETVSKKFKKGSKSKGKDFSGFYKYKTR